MTSVRDRHLRVWYRFPEPDLAIFAFQLNFPWEFRQVSLHADMAQMPHWTAVEACTQAALGDVVIMLNAYWTVCRRARHPPLEKSPDRLPSGSSCEDRPTIPAMRQRFPPRSRNALPTTDTELRLIASAAMIGDNSNPKTGYSTPAAIGTPSAL